MADTVLIIDDDINLLQALSSRLERAGYQVVTAATKAELDMQPCAQVDHILLDLKFGETNGLELIKPLKMRFNPKNLVILTGYASIATSVAAIKAGATDYLAKPIQTQVLLQTLATDEELPPELSDQPLTPAQLEWEHIQRVMQEHQGNISATARALGMHRRTLQRKLSKHSPLKQ
ncbi:two-component system response regulator [Pseudidiomarina tainanensis]|uniref:Two-component system response regulator n=1 Tax=Pseudidiomarina tainanensis TaxID=502365 RepID=A0ACD2HH65_9GAMM|nr:response regulator [Pseudidiomarina tainanensis]RZQ55900.1 two-component system response regulator [Pseudidiomarina tainanensis]